MAWLSFVYVIVCAFRSLFPRADIQRLVLFHTWLSSITLGRSVATVAELCFIIQWALLLGCLANTNQSGFVRGISRIIVPLIVLAELCSWYGVLTTNPLGSVIEESLWAFTFALIAIALAIIVFHKPFIAARRLFMVMTVGIGGFLVFMLTVDIPMYIKEWLTDMSHQVRFFGLSQGIYDATLHQVVSYDIGLWHSEIPWMSFYFSIGVWTSLLIYWIFVRQERYLNG